MSRAAAAVERLLALGDPGRRPAGAVVGVRSGDRDPLRDSVTREDVAADGWAALPTADRPGTTMRTDTRLDLASVTKVAATTVLVMRLVERGELTLDDLVARHVGGFTGAGRDDVRLVHLLTHTAGLAPWRPLYCTTTDRDAALALVVAAPLLDAPGSRRVYSDLGFVLAGLVVERVTGLRLDDAVRTLVAEPLGLDLGVGPVPPETAATSADSDVVEHTMVATGRPYPVAEGVGDFDGWRAGPVRGRANDGNAAHALGGVAGHAGLFATVPDLLTLGARLCDGTLVHPETLARFARPTPGAPDQAVGFRLASRPGPDGAPETWLWHGGFTGTVWGLAPGSGAVVAAGAMRLHGTTGPLVPRGPTAAADLPDPLAGLASGDDIAAVALDAAAPEGAHR